jgi:large subunit ribosomal protein L19
MSIAASIISSIEKATLRTAALPEFRPGDSIKVWAKIREGEKTRLQAFEGVCIRRTRKGNRSTFTVRKISYGVGVERTFPDHSPNIDRIDIMQRGRVRQSRLFYLRDPAAPLEGAAAEAANAAAFAADGSRIKGRGARKRKKDAKVAR